MKNEKGNEEQGQVVKITIKHNFPAVQRQLDQLQKDVAGKALASTVNKTVAQGKTSMSREIRSEFNISASKVSAALRVNKASFRNGLYRIEASLESPTKRGRSLNLINFTARKTSRGLSVKIKKGGPRKIIAGGFIGNQGSTAFRRTGEPKRKVTKGPNIGRLKEPIKALQTIDVAQMFNTKRINARVVKFMETKFPGIFAHEAKYYLDRFNRGRA